MRAKSLKILDILMPLVALGVILALWGITAKAVGSELLFPSLSTTFSSLFELVKSAEFYLSVGHTLLRSLLSFALAFAVGILLAVLSALCRPIRKLLSPVIVIVRVIPTMSVILLALVWVSSYVSPILVAFVVICPLIYGGYLSAIDGVDKDLVDMCKIYKVGAWQRVKSLYLPCTALSLFDTVKSTLGLTVKLVIAAEVLAQTKDSIGLGMQLSKIYLDTPILLAWTIVAILLGGALEGLIAILKKIYTSRKI